MKTICFVVPAFPKPTQTFVLQQVLAAKSLGYNVKILTKRIENIAGSTQEKLIFQNQILENVITEKYSIPKNKILRCTNAVLLIAKNFRIWKTLIKTEKNCKEKFLVLPFKISFYKGLKNIDVFHIQFAVAGVNLAKMKGVGLIKARFVTTFHGYDAHYSTLEQKNELKIRYKQLLNLSEYITVNTPYLAAQVEKLGNISNKLHIIPMGIAVDFFKNKPKVGALQTEKVKLISIGRLIEFKGFTYAIQAVKLLVNLGYNVEYTIIGEGVLKSSLETLISKLNLEKHVFLVGKKTQEEIKNNFNKHHIFLMSSVIDSTGRGETQGVVTAEAQAAGLPIVAFNCAGIPYTIANQVTGLLVPEKNINKYAEAIAALINNPDKYRKMSQAAVQYSKNNFSNSIMGQRFAELYN